MEQKEKRRLVVFEMDETLLRGRFIEACANKFLFDDELAYLKTTIVDPAELVKSIAKLFKGLTRDQLLLVISRMTIIDETVKVVRELQKEGAIVGIISESYQFAVDYVKNILGADFGIGNRLEFVDDKATGDVTIPAYLFYKGDKYCEHDYCKTNAMVFTACNYNVSIEDTMAIGATTNDLCMIRHSGTGFAFCTKSQELRQHAYKAIDKLSFASLLNEGHFAASTRYS